MDKTQTMIIDYDREEDILYISLKPGQEAICIEEGNGLLIRVDPDTNEILGYTIIDFLGKFGDESSSSVRVELPLLSAQSENPRLYRPDKELKNGNVTWNNSR